MFVLETDGLHVLCLNEKISLNTNKDVMLNSSGEIWKKLIEQNT